MGCFLLMGSWGNADKQGLLVAMWMSSVSTRNPKNLVECEYISSNGILWWGSSIDLPARTMCSGVESLIILVL